MSGISVFLNAISNADVVWSEGMMSDD